METNPSKLKRYIYEYALIALSGCVVFLFAMFNDLNKFIRSELVEQNNEMIKALEKNNEALRQFTDERKNFYLNNKKQLE